MVTYVVPIPLPVQATDAYVLSIPYGFATELQIVWDYSKSTYAKKCTNNNSVKTISWCFF